MAGLRQRVSGLGNRARDAVRGTASQTSVDQPTQAAPAGQAVLSPAPRFNRLPDLQPFPDARYLFVVDSMPWNFGGRTASILNKCRVLKEHGGVDSTIVALEHSSLSDSSEDLRRRGLLVDGMRIVNLHDYFGQDGAGVAEPVHQTVDEPGMEKIRDPDQDVYRYFRDGVYRLYKRFDQEGRLIVRDWFNENRARTQRDDFRPDGTISRTTYMDLEFNKPRQQILFRSDGSPYMNKWLTVDPQTQSSRVERITLLDHQGRPTQVMQSNVELIHTCLAALVGDDHVFMSVESRTSDGAILSFERPNVQHISVLHNSHLVPPGDDLTDLRPAYQSLFKRRDSLPAIVFLTNAQRADAEAQFGERKNFYVIPHPVAAMPPTPFEYRDPNLVVMVARLDNQKQLTHAIDAFAHVVKEVPDAQLEIYGQGRERAALQRRIDDLGLRGSVTLTGYTEDPAAVYRRAALSILTSIYEGFGLVLLESLANGCPVVSYDVKYGPRDIVADGVNGYLVDPGDKRALAQRIVDVLTDRPLRRRLSEQAATPRREFSEEAFAARWSELFRELDAQGWG